MKKPSIPALQALEDAICDGGVGTIRATCGFCHRTHFNYLDRHHYDPGELEDLENKAKAEPARYVATDCTIGTGVFLGRDYVWGCRCEEFRTMVMRVMRELPALSKWAVEIAAEYQAEADAAKTVADNLAPLSE